MWLRTTCAVRLARASAACVQRPKTTPAQKDAELAVAQVPVMAQERTRFDLSRRLWTAQGIVHFDEQELAGWNPTRDVGATACDVALTGALMNGFGLPVEDAL